MERAIDSASGYLKILESKPHAFFGARGYELRFEDGDVVWVDLVQLDTGAAISKYGRGDSESSAAERAMARWLKEQGRQQEAGGFRLGLLPELDRSISDASWRLSVEMVAIAAAGE